MCTSSQLLCMEAIKSELLGSTKTINDRWVQGIHLLGYRHTECEW